jgi:hypothetical protein
LWPIQNLLSHRHTLKIWKIGEGISQKGKISDISSFLEIDRWWVSNISILLWQTIISSSLKDFKTLRDFEFGIFGSLSENQSLEQNLRFHIAAFCCNSLVFFLVWCTYWWQAMMT